MYERAAGDKSLPSDIRPPEVLKVRDFLYPKSLLTLLYPYQKTLDYLFHVLLPSADFDQTFPFLRDRTRAVRNDFTLQRSQGPLAIECHERVARFHILSLHLRREQEGGVAIEVQQLMNSMSPLPEDATGFLMKRRSASKSEGILRRQQLHIRFFGHPVSVT